MPTKIDKRLVAFIVVALLLVGGLTAYVVTGINDATDTTQAVEQEPTPTPTVGATSEPAKKRPQPCKKQTADEFTPATISVVGLNDVGVMALPRDSNDVPGVPPLTAMGKQAFAWDPGRLPGNPAGHVLLNAHTYPDGSALGNKLLNELEDGGRIVVKGAGGATRCYSVTERFEVEATSTDSGYYADDGPPLLAIIVCSGVRRGPGDWSHRTIWFAKPLPVKA